MTPVELQNRNRQSVADILNTLLADEFVLYTQTRNAHWNIKGQSFRELHAFFEEQYQILDKIVDDVAERVRAIEHFAIGTLSQFSELTQIDEKTELSVQKVAITTLLSAHETIIQYIKKQLNPVAEKYNDPGTADFMTGVMKEHEKMAWMLRSYL
ncbi:MAG: DNA starvation/stationary phase protection protein [Bacteroidia bacterium]|jgi:starvation-inducible DNA-binding protein|nr:DNA starvation/stationary phase protection protein [Bacteroidia bacterium]